MKPEIICLYKTKGFSKWMKKERLTDKSLKLVADELRVGFFDADLGGGLIKKRGARIGGGKRSGYRVLLTFIQDKRVFLIFGFSKKDRENIKEIV